MSCPLFWLMFGLWLMMAFNFGRLYRVYRETNREVDEWARLCEKLMRHMRSPWN